MKGGGGGGARKVESCVFRFAPNRKVKAMMLYPSKSSGKSHSACADQETLCPYEAKLNI